MMASDALPPLNPINPPPLQTHALDHGPHPSSPPSRRDLKSWWKTFKNASAKHPELSGHARVHHGTDGLHIQSHPPRSISCTITHVIKASSEALNRRQRRDQDSHVHQCEHVFHGNYAIGETVAIVADEARLPVCSEFQIESSRTQRSGAVHECLEVSPACIHPLLIQSRSEPASRPFGIFGVPLRQSITYANVAISLIDENGESYVYGYVPIVVAKCGVFLKDRG